MKQSKPTNSVTRRMEDMLSGLDYTTKLPLLDNTQLVALEDIFPPRTKLRSESDDDHSRYAGVVELVQRLRTRSDNHVSDDDGEPEDDLTGAERAP